MIHTTCKVRARLTEVRRMQCWLCHQSLEAHKTAWQDRQEGILLYDQYPSLTALHQSAI